MTKPVGPLCNLDCAYCFYLEKERLFPEGENYRMSDAVLETYVRKYIRSQHTPEINFAWQGGEPTLMGLDFFRKVVALQRSYSGGRTVRNSFQTNGVDLTDEWCAFFAREKFLIGLSLDGPAPIHNRYRVDKGGAGSYDHVMKALALLKKWQVEFNTLTCVTRQSPDEAVEIYTFLRGQGVTFMQFIPVVERVGDRAAHEVGLELAVPPDLRSADNQDALMPWSVSSEGFGTFLCAVFDEWIRQDVGHIYVNIFDAALGAWCGMESGMCVFAETCGTAVAMEHDGGVYSCDHFVYPSCNLGNIMDVSFEEMIYAPHQIAFGKDKSDALPPYCRECEYLFACNGECPKHRFLNTPAGDPGLNYLCAGLKHFFRHIDPAMREMAKRVQRGQPASGLKNQAAPPDKTSTDAGRTKRNDPCPCGSGKKYKKCCGA